MAKAKEGDGRLVPVTPLVELARYQPAFLGEGGDGSAMVDMLSGEIRPMAPPTSKLNDLGKLRLIQLILAGEEDQTIADILVREQFVTSYTKSGVSYWRERPEVQAALHSKYRAAFQVGLASKEKRLKALEEIAEAMRDDLLEFDPANNKMRMKRTYVNARGIVTDVMKRDQYAGVKEYRELLAKIGEMIDEPAGKDINVNIGGNVEHSQTVAMIPHMDNSKEALLRRLLEATETIEAEFSVELPDSLSGGKSTGMELVPSPKDGV